ncbi:MAG: NAD(P)-dependent alcohol dehydrogenase [Saprospiraceae bacterium]|nr:NAD(P)-dependent alcohol dehydrogenase [Saprospiraceae bacterium]
MKAIIIEKYGEPEVLKLKNIEKPTPKPDEVLIKIKATSVTASDVLIRSLKVPFLYRLMVQLIFGFGRPRNPILGMVAAGVVADKGAAVSKFNVGDEVFAYCSMPPMKLRFGSYAEYICLPEEWNLALKPTNISFEEAAAIPYGGLLATHLINKTSIKKGDKVLIYGASGSIGTMAVQLAKNAGAIVTSVCSAKNFELVKSLGSDKVIDYTASEAESQLETYQYVIDAVGKNKTSLLKEKSKQAINRKGKYLSIDDGAPQTPKKSFLALKALVEQRKLRAVIDSVYPLEEVVEAHRYVERGHKRGSVILTIN